jgi:sulfotransferase family protein
VSLRVVGAGFPRTGTKSLKEALERLLGGRCYHMVEVFEHLEHVPVWRDTLAGRPPVWNDFLVEYAAAVDWPASAFWRELVEANPDALIVLSVRDDAEAWWRSADRTIFTVTRREEYPQHEEWLALAHELLEARIGRPWDDERAAKAAYGRHNDDVRANADPRRLLEWNAREGWPPLCEALGLPVPEEPFPRINTTEEWAAREAEAAEEAAVQ